MTDVRWIRGAVVLLIGVLLAHGAIAQEAGELSGPVSVIGDDAASGGTEGAPLGGGVTEGVPQAQPGFPMWLWLPLIGVMIFMIWSSGANQKKIRKEHEALMSSLTKHDKVQTQGGVIGTVVEIHGDEIVLKVDESSGTRVRFAKSSVTRVLSQSHLRGKDDSGVKTEDKNEESTAA